MICDLFVGLFAVSLFARAHAKDITNINFFDVIALYEDYDSELLSKFGPIEGEFDDIMSCRGVLFVLSIFPYSTLVFVGRLLA